MHTAPIAPSLAQLFSELVDGIEPGGNAFVLKEGTFVAAHAS